MVRGEEGGKGEGDGEGREGGVEREVNDCISP